MPEEQPSSATWKDEKKSFLMLLKEKGKTKKTRKRQEQSETFVVGEIENSN